MQAARVHLARLEKPVYISHSPHIYPSLTPGQANPVATKIHPKLLPISLWFWINLGRFQSRDDSDFLPKFAIS